MPAWTLSKKVTLLRDKLGLLMGSTCAEYDEIVKASPDALLEPWSSDMSGSPRTYAIINNATFAISETEDREVASALARDMQRIDCGENIELYGEALTEYIRDLHTKTTPVNDVLGREAYEANGYDPRASALRTETPGHWLVMVCVEHMKKIIDGSHDSEEAKRQLHDERADIFEGFMCRVIQEGMALGERPEWLTIEYFESTFLQDLTTDGVFDYCMRGPGMDIASAYFERKGML